jgi:type I restriction enzyme S subunit
MYLRPILRKFEMEGTVFGSLTKTDFEEIQVRIPSKEIVENFNNRFSPIDAKIFNNQCQIDELTKLKKAILPKLISGKIRVNEVNQK